MPIIRYQIRNEYGLADPELYGAADKEDPEALLEGVAMAGLVGVLRQLGDLAEFAAEIFHNLHEEVMATAARGHVLMLRVQQLEVDFPAIERGSLSQTSHSQLSYNAGSDWHPNLQIDQNLITREDMPRFILDSYEESRGPPRLFMLDKFDIAGDGACLKRYSDPSFFKMDFATSGKMELDIQREKRFRKKKKKVPRWRNGETPESHITPHGNPKLEHVVSEKAPENPPVKRVKLKTRQLDDNTSIRRSYMEHVVRKLSPEHSDLSVTSVSHSQVKMKTIDSTELAPDVREVIMDTSMDRPFFRERNQTKPYNKEEVSLTWKEDAVSDLRDSQNEKVGLLQKATGEVERLPSTFDGADQKELLDADSKREANDDAGSRTSGSLDGYRSDDAASELDNYLDALTTMDSEIETDNETKAKVTPSFFSKDYNKMDSNVNAERELLDECLGSHTSRDSSPQNSLSNKRVSSPPNEDSLNSLADSTPSDGTSRALPGMFIDPEAPADETHDINFEKEANNEPLGKDTSIDLVPKQMSTDIPIPLSESAVESSGSCITDTTAALIYASLHASPEDKQSATVNQNTSSSNTDSTEKNGVCFDGAYSPSDNSGVLGAVDDVNVMVSNLAEGDGEVDKLLEDGFHQRSDESKTEDDCINPGLLSKNTEAFSDALLQLRDKSDSNLLVQGGLSLETQVAVLCAEAPSAEGIMSMPSVSDPPQLARPTNLEVTSAICIEDSSLPFSMLSQEEMHGSVCQGPEVDSGESTLPGKCPPIFPLDNSCSTFAPDGLFGPGDNSILSDDKFECARSLTDPEDAADFTENKVTIPENTGNFAENEVIASGVSLPEPSLEMHVSQKSSNLDQVEFTQKGELLPQEPCNLDQVEFTQKGELLPQEPCNLDPVEFTQKGELLPQEPCNVNQVEFTQKGELVPQESCNVDQVEFLQNGELPNDLKVLSNLSNYEMRDSFLVNGTRDSPSPSRDHLNLLTGMIPFSSPMESLPAESSSPHSLTECTEADELYSATVHSKESSSNDTNLQEDHSSSDSASEHQKLEVTEASCVKDLIDLDVQQVPGTFASKEEYVVVPCPQVSASAGYILDSSSQPDCGEDNRVCHTEPSELAQEDLYLSDGNSAAVSFVEVEGGKLLSAILQNESNSIDSDIGHYLGNIEVSNSEDLTCADDHQASKVACAGREESDAVSDPGGSKSAECIHDSFNRVDMKPVISVSCQEGWKMVVSPQNSGIEERLLESSKMSDIESVNHAEVSMHSLEVTEVIEYPLETQQVSYCKPLVSSEPCQAANGDALLCDDVIIESVGPSKEVFSLQSADESDENSLLQKIGSLNLSDIQFETEQAREQDDNSIKSENQPSVPEGTHDSVEAVSSGKVYALDITSGNVATSNQLETEVDSPLQSSFGLPLSSAISTASLASLQSFPCIGGSGTAMIQQQSSELPLDSDPPLPPLPPLQWRMGKLRPSFVMTNGEMTRPQSGPNNLTTLPSLDHSGGSLAVGGVEVQPSNPFLQVQMHPNDGDQFDYQTLKDERMNPFQSNALPPAMEHKKCQDDILALDVQMKHLPANLSSVVSHVEDQQKNEFCIEALSGAVPQSINPFTSPLELSDVRSQHSQRVSEGESIEPPRSSASQPTLVCTQSLHGTASMVTATIHPFNPFLSSTSMEGEHCQYDYGAFDSRMVQHLNGPDPVSTVEIAPQSFFISQGGNLQTFESVNLPTSEHEKPNGRPRSLLNRPRDPLIEAVASHDKSTLRRVSELARPSAKPEGERNTLLEQIKNKSFNLKPATVAKPNIKGPPTNLKVAAILERANAIRQAFVGSDEDDDGDSWSDS